MADPRGIGWFVTTVAGLVLAAPSCAMAADPQASDLQDWLSRTTDLKASQIALVSVDSVYSLEPLGARLPTGEVIVLVRTEPRTDGSSAAQGFRSWDANLLIDCAQRRLRVIRSATYPQRNRGGPPTPETQDHVATSPRDTEPAAKLIAAACDANYVWPLRPPAPATAKLATGDDAAPDARRLDAQVKPRAPQALQTPPSPATRPAGVPGPWVLQLARGPSEDGARRTLARARTTLGPLAQSLRDATTASPIPGDRMGFYVGLEGFATVTAAQEACRKLLSAGQSCFVRRGFPRPAIRQRLR